MYYPAESVAVQPPLDYGYPTYSPSNVSVNSAQSGYSGYYSEPYVPTPSPHAMRPNYGGSISDPGVPSYEVPRPQYRPPSGPLLDPNQRPLRSPYGSGYGDNWVSVN